MRKFDAVRYGSLSFGLPPPRIASRSPAQQSMPRTALHSMSSRRWRVAARFQQGEPAVDMQPHRVIAAGFGQGGEYLTTYVNVLHRWQRRGGNGPIFDGYLTAGTSSAAPINQCAAPLPDADPRRVALPHDVPFVRVMTESDFNLAAALRRDDSDEAADVFRLYEIAGTGHNAPIDAGLLNVAMRAWSAVCNPPPTCAASRAVACRWAWR